MGTLITQNTSVVFQVVGYSNPSMYRVAIWKSTGVNGSEVVAIKNTSSSLVIDLQSGNYYLSAFASWNDGRAVGYTFEIVVSA
ncbi:MAG: hypothetical protein ACHQYR_01770 [Candidatus Gagatemarchaeaceae archaeon]